MKVKRKGGNVVFLATQATEDGVLRCVDGHETPYKSGEWIMDPLFADKFVVSGEFFAEEYEQA